MGRNDARIVLNRRRLLRSGSAGFCAFLLGGIESRTGLAQAPVLFGQLAGLGGLGPPDENDLRLPAGFRSRIVARSRERVIGSSSYRWHDAPDGGACYGTSDGGWIYVSNSEVGNGRGGAGAIRFDAGGGIVDAYPILEGTNVNCAGGRTPWDTWLSCEETDRGLVYECDPYGIRPGVACPALGRFEHEAVAVDPDRGHLYLTEDTPDGGLYRFRPANGLPDLDAGTLEIAEVVARGGGRFVVWHAVEDPRAESVATRYQAPDSTPFDGGEGIAWSDGMVYFTTKGDNRVWSCDCATGQIDVLYDAATARDPHLSGVDNVTITATGDVLVAEDGGDMQLVLLSQAGDVIPVVQVVNQDESEICGPAFSPAFDRLYFSSQTGRRDRDGDGIIYEVSHA